MTDTGTVAPAERITVPGLSATAEINIDRWGIPHIRAAHISDLFFVQGFNAARDRLWHIDLWRKRGLGILAADFGPGYLAQDRAARLFLYRGDMAAEWAAYGPDAKEICIAFTNGINAFIDLVDREPVRLPPEFEAFGTRPAKWAPEDVVRIRTHGWVRNAVSEILRASVMAKADAEADLLRANLEPHIVPQVPDDLDLSTVPLSVLDTYRLAITPVSFSKERLAATLDQAWDWIKVTPLGEVIRDTRLQGSNNWAIDGAHTATGRPILANDPHRAHAVPSLRYLVHLTAPGFDAIGAGEPVFPGVMVGHNGTAAFGLTLFFGPDQEDVYYYETDPGDPDRYRYDRRWERMDVVEERFSVKGEADQTLTLKFTRHGPVISESPPDRRAFAVRTIFSEPGTAPYAASLVSMRTRTFDAFKKAMRLWKVPTVNQVYADTSGDIAWIAAGWSPVRENWDGLLPVPGDGRYEWNGYLTSDELPHLHNPASGYVATANEMNLPPDWPFAEKPVGYEWIEGSRALRVNEVLSADSRQTVASSCALQTDVLSIPARRLAPVFRSLRPNAAEARRALDLLGGWDHRLDAASGPAALFELWWTKHLKPALFARLLPDESVAPLLAPGDVESILRSLEEPDARMGKNPLSARDDLLASTLAAAYADCAERMGPDPAGWAWGKLHQIYFQHALSAIDAAASPKINVGPFEMGGSESTPMNASYRPGDFRVTLGASVRVVVDVGDWDNSVCINAPGQSGDPRSAHYADLAPVWAKGEYVPMLYSAGAVDGATETRIVLTPA